MGQLSCRSESIEIRGLARWDERLGNGTKIRLSQGAQHIDPLLKTDAAVLMTKARTMESSNERCLEEGTYLNREQRLANRLSRSIVKCEWSDRSERQNAKLSKHGSTHSLFISSQDTLQERGLNLPGHQLERPGQSDV